MINQIKWNGSNLDEIRKMIPSKYICTIDPSPTNRLFICSAGEYFALNIFDSVIKNDDNTICTRKGNNDCYTKY